MILGNYQEAMQVVGVVVEEEVEGVVGEGNDDLNTIPNHLVDTLSPLLKAVASDCKFYIFDPIHSQHCTHLCSRRRNRNPPCICVCYMTVSQRLLDTLRLHLSVVSVTDSAFESPLHKSLCNPTNQTNLPLDSLRVSYLGFPCWR